MTTHIYLVPHTHWDREWYQPFQSFRLGLVEAWDALLDLMDRHDELTFTLDGQTAVVDDYLEVRPEGEPRIRSLVSAGRLAVGPWRILMDEFLVSGETIVRNLEAGWRRGEELGGAMPVGYLPDMFGHTAQMPQILRKAGIRDAVVWRGVPAAIDRHAFAWEAPDGSVVRAEYLVGGYGNAAYLLNAPTGRLADKVEHFHRAMEPFFGEDDLLAMQGKDHAVALPDLVEMVEAINHRGKRFRVSIATLDHYVLRFRGSTDGLARWRGELRSGARANLLMGVTSARLNLKAACSRAERALERYAEPLQALYGGSWPGSLLALAWERVVASSGHDSICGCSVDEVVAQVLVRLAEAEQIGRGLADRAAEAVSALLPRGWTAVLNPSPHLRGGLVELSLIVPESWSEVALETIDGTMVAAQEVNRQAPALLEAEMPAAQVPELFRRRMHGRELFGRQLNGYRLDEVEGTPRLILEVDLDPDPPWLDVETLAEEVARQVEAAGQETWKVRVAGVPRRTVQAIVTVPPLGWRAVRAVEGTGEPEHPVVADDGSLDNGLVRVEVDELGTLSISGQGVALAGVGRLVDGGDAGDSYNYAPPEQDRLVDQPSSVEVRMVASGPVRGEMAAVRSYAWPRGLDGEQRSEQSLEVEVTTRIELRAGEPFCRLRVDFENLCRDHRLRLHIPLPHQVDRSWAEGQFAVVERGLTAEGGHGEVPLPTFPARGFVAVEGAAVLLDHVMEYEVVKGRELALTLLRSIGLISRNTNAYREEPAGPEVSIPGAQCLGPWSVELGVYPLAGSWVEAGVLTQMEQYQHPFLVAHGTGTTASADPPTGLTIEGEGVVLSSLRRRGDWLEMRVVNQHPRPVTARVRGAFQRARQVDLLGRPGEPLAVEGGTLEVELSPWEISTVQMAS
ncbi:MAG: glycoside hydrolase family 38 C-terminal domain-containing protein [Acidimicrobiia bacterium]